VIVSEWMDGLSLIPSDGFQSASGVGHNLEKSAELRARIIITYSTCIVLLCHTTISYPAIAAMAEHALAARQATIAIDILGVKIHAEHFRPFRGHLCPCIIVVLLGGKKSRAMGTTQTTTGHHDLLHYAIKSFCKSGLTYFPMRFSKSGAS